MEKNRCKNRSENICSVCALRDECQEKIAVKVMVEDEKNNSWAEFLTYYN